MANEKKNKNASAQVSVTGKSDKSGKVFTAVGFAVLAVVLVVAIFLCSAKYPIVKDEDGVVVTADA